MTAGDGITQAQTLTAVAIDVGGTTVRAGLVDSLAQLLGPPIEIPSPTAQPYGDVLQAFEDIVSRVTAGRTDPHVAPARAGIAIPGPFDYANGTSQMRHKFASLDGRPFGNDLSERLALPVRFVNDADAFALGSWASEFGSVARFLGVTLGTGVGSGFVVDGSLVGAEENAPADDEIWYTPYRGGIFEDWISKRGIETRYQANGGQRELGVRAIADRARAGEPVAVDTLYGLGVALGDGLALAAGPFRPDAIVFGGKIALAYDVFGKPIAKAFATRAGYEPQFAQSRATEPALRGAGRAAFAS